VPAKESVEVRLLVPADLDRVLEIEAASFGDPWPRAEFEGGIRSEAPPIVAVCETQLVGYLCSLAAAAETHITNIAVDAAWQKRGIGTLLVKTCIVRAARGSCQWVYLDVRPSNRAARALYERLGFVEIFRRQSYYIRPREDSLVLARPIRPGDVPGMGTGAAGDIRGKR